MNSIELTDIHFELWKQRRSIIRDVNLEIPYGSFVIIKGPSGSGKTTLLNICGAILKPTHGILKIFNQEVTEKNLLSLRSKIGFVFQTPILFENLSVRENFYILGRWIGLDKVIIKKSTTKLLRKFDLTDYENQSPKKLSGGERQRIAIILALMGNPEIFLMDEPLGSIDYGTRSEIIEEIKTLRKESKTFLIVTHDSSFDDIADKIYFLKDGKILKNPPEGYC